MNKFIVRGFVALWAASLVALLPLSEATVIVRSGNFTSLVALPDLPASFGPGLHVEGVSGTLLLADPDDACHELAAERDVPLRPFVALISRSHDRDAPCTFEDKIRYAEEAGAIAAIVHDDVAEPLVVMAKRPSSPHPGIPSVFVTLESGLLLRRLLRSDEVQVMLTPVSDLIWISSLMSACAGALAVTLLAGILYWTRRPFPFLDGRRGSLMYQRPGNPRVVMTAEQLRKIPMIVCSDISFMSGSADDLLTALHSKELETQRGRKTAGETRRMCCICLESYSCGEKLRVLPCAHRFHASCIDQWLMYRQSLCPVCKADARSKITRSFQSSNRNFFSGRRGMVLAWLRNRWDSAPWRRPGRESVSTSSTTIIASNMESHDFAPIEDAEILQTLDSNSVAGDFSSNVYSEGGDVRLLDQFETGGANTSLTGHDAGHGDAADVPDVGMHEVLNNDSNFSESPISDGEWDLEAAAVMRTRRN